MSEFIVDEIQIKIRLFLDLGCTIELDNKTIVGVYIFLSTEICVSSRAVFAKYNKNVLKTFSSDRGGTWLPTSM